LVYFEINITFFNLRAACTDGLLAICNAKRLFLAEARLSLANLAFTFGTSGALRIIFGPFLIVLVVDALVARLIGGGNLENLVLN
jgi:hypothetical protein